MTKIYLKNNNEIFKIKKMENIDDFFFLVININNSKPFFELIKEFEQTIFCDAYLKLKSPNLSSNLTRNMYMYRFNNIKENEKINEFVKLCFNMDIRHFEFYLINIYGQNTFFDTIETK